MRFQKSARPLCLERTTRYEVLFEDVAFAKANVVSEMKEAAGLASCQDAPYLNTMSFLALGATALVTSGGLSGIESGAQVEM